MLIGFTGKRGVGKTTLADILVRDFGFIKIHAFAPGKAMTMAYYQHLGIDVETAYRLTYGDLRDVKHPLIPGDGLSRTFMEKLGYHMGVDMGSEYTLGAEVAVIKRMHPGADIVVESVVYEAKYFKQIGGTIVKVVRDSPSNNIVGMHTDGAVDAIVADVHIFNDYAIDVLPARLFSKLIFIDPTAPRSVIIHQDNKVFRTKYIPTQGIQDEDITIEYNAEILYNSWKSADNGWVPWVVGGNSVMQDQARFHIRKSIADDLNKEN